MIKRKFVPISILLILVLAALACGKTGPTETPATPADTPVPPTTTAPPPTPIPVPPTETPVPIIEQWTTDAVASSQYSDPDWSALQTVGEGRCVQMLHVGPYEKEHETIAIMQAFAEEQGLAFHGLHHEIYLSDPRRVAPEKLKTILRRPVK